MAVCFVMQPFDDNGRFDKRFTDVFSPAITAAGLKPYRVDSDPTVEIPIEEIERGIREAEICFAEITTDNPNVWFELGYALAFDKPVCMVCSEERQSKFPFDIQHRKVLRYSVGSSSDFADLSKRITERLHGLIERRKGQATIESLRPTVQTGGLTPHEVTALAIAVSGNEETFDLVSVHQFKSMMERSGFNETASGLSIRSLIRKRMVEIREIEGGWNQNGFNAVVPTDLGVDWLLHNQSKLNLNATKISKGVENDKGIDDVPF